MLVLLVGATGNLGKQLLDSLHSHNHTVRVISRDPDKLSADVLSKVESCVSLKDGYDTEAFDKACRGVDAVINAWAVDVRLQLECQLLLLRAAEQAKVKIFVAASWTADLRKISFGEHENYDPYKAFMRAAELSCSIKPIYIITGVFAEVLFSSSGQGFGVPFNPETKEYVYWDDGERRLPLTTQKDAAEFTVEIMEREDAANGGYWCVFSELLSPKEIARVYDEVRGEGAMRLTRMGSVQDLEKLAHDSRARGRPTEAWTYIIWFYQLFTTTGIWTPKEGEWHHDLLSVKRTSLKQFLEDNSDT